MGKLYRERDREGASRKKRRENPNEKNVEKARKITTYITTKQYNHYSITRMYFANFLR